MLSISKLFIAASLVVIFAGGAQANQNSRVPTPSATPLPMQFFCASNPRECVSQRDARAQWNDDLHAMLVRVNNQVNSAISPQANPRRGWAVNPSSGDCNDYVLTKRSRLIAMGVPAGALRLAVTSTRRGERHLILVVKTTSGDIVLDNLSNNIKTLRDSGYSINAMSTANPRRWTAN